MDQPIRRPSIAERTADASGRDRDRWSLGSAGTVDLSTFVRV